MYRIINEDNSLVSEYPSNKLYDLLTDQEKEYIRLIKNEIEKLTEEEGLGKITVSLSPEGDILEKAFQIKANGYTFSEFEEKIDNIRDQMFEFYKDNEGLKEFFYFAYIISA
ncbi:MAG: hypothetical protein IKV87_09510 [Methanobrevibacter sp.]|nr:hypothetical protein [Methanobrevibacter sp.]